MKLKYIITCLAIIACVSTGKAQETNKLSLQYAIGIPTGGLNDYVSETSFRGLKFSYKYMLTPTIGLGFDAGMQTFYESEYGTFREGSSALTGNQYRYANNFPLLVTFAYYLMPEQTLNPYIDLGIGTVYTRQDTEIGLYNSSVDAWQFALKPEIGIIYQLNPTFGIKLSGNYYGAFENDELGSQSFGSINIGFVTSGSR